MRRLNGIDADMIYAETPTWHMHIGGLMVLDPSGAPAGSDFDGARRLIAGLAAELAPLRERLVEVPLGLDRPRWVQDPAFDLDSHLHRVTLPSPGGSRELGALVSEFAGTKLDRSRPLWEMWFIEGLEHGYVAILTKVHHACADGTGGALLMGRFLTTEPRPAPSEMSSVSTSEASPSDLQLLIEAVPHLAALPVRTAQTLARTATAIWRTARRPRESEGAPAAKPFSAPRTSFNRPVGVERSVAFTELPLADVEAVRQAFGATVNDVVLAVCAGALRLYLAARDELPDAPLVAAVPVSVRTAQEFASFGNMVSGWFANLATDVEDPATRLRDIRDAARSAKRVFESGAEDVVMDWARLPIPALWAAAAPLYASSPLTERLPPIFNVLISNVPGPPIPLYAGEARVVSVFPFGPVLDVIGLNLTVLSYVDSIEVGIMTCPELVPEVWSLTDYLRESLAELVEAASAQP